MKLDAVRLCAGILGATLLAAALCWTGAVAVAQPLPANPVEDPLPPPSDAPKDDRGVGSPQAGAMFKRLEGLNRYATAKQISMEMSDFKVVALASGESSPDALAGAALAATLEGSVLLTCPKEVPPPLASFVSPGLWQTIWICGGRNSVGEGVYASLYQLANP
ncbi:MAG: cell wall-binding repeat-containing protein [Buchananella hordeovulneris]|nr:cell wall-binding repeat-containing protein [Buchananella hordeovulneris]